MLQNPRVAFRDPQLKTCSIEKDERNQPRPWAGAFAVVYKGIDANGVDPFAVRVFTTESPERRERYELISAYLKGRKLNCLVDFEYRDRSIRSAGDGRWYPLITMEWVQGETLFKWVRARCFEGNRPALADAARRWVDLVRELAEASVSHGDLQHANVMVTTRGELKLVDYDCMCVPALVGRRNLEVGVEPYQHPQRNEATLLSLDLDHFSALMIYVGLRALAADPQFWMRYVEQTGYDKLLFRREDFEAPAQSNVYRELMACGDQEVRDLTAQLFNLYRTPIQQVPPLGQLANSYAQVEELLRRQEWAAAVEALNRRGQFRDAPEHLKPSIQKAYEYVCREEAWTAFCRVPAETSEVNDRRLVRTWNESLFAGFVLADQQRFRVSEARRRVAVLDKLKKMLQRSSSRFTLAGEREIAETAAQLPQGYKYEAQARVDQARRRTQSVGRLQKAIETASSEAGIIAAWRAVMEAKCEPMVPSEWRARIDLAQRRAPVLRTLHEMPDALPPVERDRRLLSIWQEDLFADCNEAQRWRPAYDQAAARRQMLAALQTAVEADDQKAILGLLEQPCLSGYPLPPALESAAETVRLRILRTETMLTALEAGRREAFCESFDARAIRDDAERFAPYHDAICDWTQDVVLSPERIGLLSAPDQENVVPLKDAPGEYQVLWTWPDGRYSEQCLLAICADEPPPDADPEYFPAYLRQLVDRADWRRGQRGHVIRTEPDWGGGCVVVWAVVALGFATFHSAPLVLGRLKKRSRWKWLGRRGRSAKGGEATPDQAEDEPE